MALVEPPPPPPTPTINDPLDESVLEAVLEASEARSRSAPSTWSGDVGELSDPQVAPPPAEPTDPVEVSAMSTPTDPAAAPAAAAHEQAPVPLWQDAEPAADSTERPPHHDPSEEADWPECEDVWAAFWKPSVTAFPSPRSGLRWP
ncbi:hypothetical protein ACLF6K_09290 [Streptomyces xanthophaeus]|uniref:hypothetical protein n=1 Tax=Streptomyces xanthophaeus TaxID=67385 RepID=UPI003990105F